MVRTCGLSNYSDVHYTHEEVARRVIEHFRPSGRILEPFLGEGAFLRHLPPDTDWCEIAKGRDFFVQEGPYDWLITNPPFSNLTQIFEHAFALSANCVFLIPISKYWSSAPRLSLARAYGGLKEIVHLGSGRAIGFNLGFPFAALHFARGYVGPISETWL